MFSNVADKLDVHFTYNVHCQQCGCVYRLIIQPKYLFESSLVEYYKELAYKTLEENKHLRTEIDKMMSFMAPHLPSQS